MRVAVMMDKFIADQKTDLSSGAHEDFVVNKFLCTPEQCIGQGWVTAGAQHEWLPMRKPQNYYTLSVRGGGEASVGAEVATEDFVSLHTRPTALMESAEKVPYLVEQTGVNQEIVEHLLDKFGDVDITLHLGSHATLVFRTKDELLRFLDQCAEIRKQLG